jgi:hypothetical protein
MRRIALACALLAPCAASAAEPPQVVVVTGSRDAEWVGYRHAYRAAARFNVMLASRPLLQAHMQIQPLRPGLPMEGIRLQLEGEKTSVALTADLVGRVTVPLIKQAFDDDAVLRLNRHKGNYRVSGLFSIRERVDQRYDAALLRSACEQMLSIQREAGNKFALMGKQCAGVKFLYALGDAEVAVTVQDGAGTARALPAIEQRGFDLPPVVTTYQVLSFRFADWPVQGVLQTATTPLAILPIYQ